MHVDFTQTGAAFKRGKWENKRITSQAYVQSLGHHEGQNQGRYDREKTEAMTKMKEGTRHERHCGRRTGPEIRM